MSAQALKLPGGHVGADLSAKQYHAVYLSNDYEISAITNANAANYAQAPIGILQDDPDADGKAAEIISIGVSRCEAGGTISAGDWLTTNDDGELIAGAIEAAAGTADRVIIGRALEDAVDGQIFNALINCITPLPVDTE